jgi:transcriptional regulator with XRE-family HTH domain
MNYLASNIRFLRKQKEMTQDALALDINVNRSMIGSYEEGRAVPRIGVLQNLSVFFGVNIDDLINKDLNSGYTSDVDIRGDHLRVLATVVDRDDREMITIVPLKASAGYLCGYGDKEYIGQLPRFSLPLPEFGNERTRRVFQIRGDSMLPVKPGSYVLCEYLQDWSGLVEGETYVLLTLNDGIVYKRVYKQAGLNHEWVLKSDNPDYRAYTIRINEVSEIWKAVGMISFDLGNPSSVPKSTSKIYEYNESGNPVKEDSGNADNPGLHQIASIVMEMRKELDELKKAKKH